MMQSSKRLSVLLLSLLSASVTGQTCCQFIASDASDCIVYGAIDGSLVEWTKANEACLEAYNIRIASIDVDTVGCGSTVSVSAFVNAIRFESIPNSVRGGLADFFVQQDNGSYVLADSITIDGTTTSCESSESDCYNAMRTYFTTSAGEAELEDVCDTVRNKAAVDRETEQSTVRIQMCQDPTTGTSVCGALSTEVADRVAEYPNKMCSAFGIGPGTMALPGCEGGVSSSSTTGATSGSNAALSAMIAGAMLTGITLLAL